MKNLKSREELINLLQEKGLFVERHADLSNILRFTSYFRLKTILESLVEYYKPKGIPTTTTLLQTCEFDNAVRLLVSRSIQHIEICFRATLVEYCIQEHRSADSYLDFNFFSCFSESDKESRTVHKRTVSTILNEFKRSKASYALEFRNTIGNKKPPIWLALETASLGNLLFLCKCSEHKFKHHLGSMFRLEGETISSWFEPIRLLRNLCAHHEILWNNKFQTPHPSYPRFDRNKYWGKLYVPSNETLFFRLLMLEQLIRWIPYRGFNVTNELKNIAAKFPYVPLEVCGFPEGWKTIPLWFD